MNLFFIIIIKVFFFFFFLRNCTEITRRAEQKCIYPICGVFVLVEKLSGTAHAYSVDVTGQN